MKKLPLFKAVNYIGMLPGDAFIRVYYDFSSHDFLIYEDGEIGNPDMLLCAGDPQKFFNAVSSAVYTHVQWRNSED